LRRALIITGCVLIVAGLLWPLAARTGLGRLPGDISIRRGSFHFYFPLVTSLIVSLALSLILWLMRK
jgi:DUF2905 family protein